LPVTFLSLSLSLSSFSRAHRWQSEKALALGTNAIPTQLIDEQRRAIHGVKNLNNAHCCRYLLLATIYRNDIQLSIGRRGRRGENNSIEDNDRKITQALKTRKIFLTDFLTGAHT